VAYSAGRESSSSRAARPVMYNPSRPIFSNKNKLLVSAAAPKRGALMPRYRPRKPSERSDCLKQSAGPL
jgi:hypothetical protein